MLGNGRAPGLARPRDRQGLLNATLTAAAALDLTRIELEVYAANAAARALPVRGEFVEEGIRRKARYLDGRYEDIIIMARLLD